MTQTRKYAMYTFVLLMAFLMLFAGAMVNAQQGGGGGAGGGAGSGDQQQDRDRVPDPATGGDTTPSQDRDQDRLQDGTGDNCVGTGDCDGTPDQDQLRTQDQDRLQDGTGDNCVGTGDCDGVPDQDRDQDRDRIHVDSTAALEQYVQQQQQERLRTYTETETGAGEMMQSRVQAQVAADAVMAAEPLMGGNGPHMSEVAQQVNQAMNGLATREEALQNRSRLQLFLFGQDDEVVAEMRQEMEQNQNRIEEMKQYMLNCEDCDQGATQFLVNQIQQMEREQARLQTVTDEAADRVGLFGFLFGWMR